jgi:hypothetical protein
MQALAILTLDRFQCQVSAPDPGKRRHPAQRAKDPRHHGKIFREQTTQHK